MPYDATVLHHVPGRMRLRIPALKGNAQRFEEVRQAVLPVPGMSEVNYNAAIGTLILSYDPGLYPRFPATLEEHPAVNGALRVRGASAANLRLTESIADKSIEQIAGNVNRKVQGATGNAVNLKELFPFSLVFYAILFVDKAVNVSQWLNWLQFAFSSYMELHQDEPVVKVGNAVETLRLETRKNAHELDHRIRELRSAIEALADEVKRGAR